WAVLINLFMSHILFAQNLEAPEQQKEKSSKPKFAAIPVPNYNEATGFGLGMIVNLLYPVGRKDEISPPSSTTLFGFYASNKTNVFGAAQKFHLKEDKYRFTLALARASINFQYYAENIGGEFIDFNTGSKFGLIKGELQVLSDFYFGLKYRYMRSRTKFDIPIEYDPPENTYSGLGPTVSYDTRDNVFNAYTGYFVGLETLFNHSALGSDQNYSIYEFKANRYLTLKDNHRLALRLFLKIGTGDVPFEDQAIMGMTDLRGYSDGKYRADQKYTIQGEYRWTFYKKIGMVAFAGVGWVADRLSEVRLKDTLPGAGVGLRYMMIPQYRINVGIDFAVGKDDTAFYFRINEAF
ncbi:MAG: BamA/TamA family outer membrane protein, partial [Candidatus Aminicenantes bacterium]